MPAEIKILNEKLERQLAKFFEDIKRAGDDKFFHPHPFDKTTASKLARYKGNDVYCVLVDGDKIIGYGMLRGWDEGYEVPSLGIIIHPSIRGCGWGKILMNFLHLTAKQRGCRQVRLKVYPANVNAVKMYKKLGYVFASSQSDQLVGFLDL